MERPTSRPPARSLHPPGHGEPAGPAVFDNVIAYFEDVKPALEQAASGEQSKRVT